MQLVLLQKNVSKIEQNGRKNKFRQQIVKLEYTVISIK